MTRTLTTNGYYVIWAPDHPIATARGLLLEHRAVLYDSIGPGEHECHWCNRTVTWRARRGAPPQADDLVVDHLDGKPGNNCLANLVASCQLCNVQVGYSRHRIRTDEETFMVLPNGVRLRAIEKSCAHCGETFRTALSEDRAYCSTECGNTARRLETCGRGHPRTPENLTAFNQCRGCLKLAYTEYRARQKAKNLSCSADGCDRPIRVRGLCSRHVGRTSKGTPSA